MFISIKIEVGRGRYDRNSKTQEMSIDVPENLIAALLPELPATIAKLSDTAIKAQIERVNNTPKEQVEPED